MDIFTQDVSRYPEPWEPQRFPPASVLWLMAFDENFSSGVSTYQRLNPCFTSKVPCLTALDGITTSGNCFFTVTRILSRSYNYLQQTK